MELSQVLQALRNADAAGDAESARRLAQIADRLMKEQAAAKPAPAEKPAEGIFGAFGKGAETALSQLRAGVKGLYAPEEAAREAKEREEDIGKRYADQVSLEKVKEAYRERGLLPAAGEAISQVPAALAEQAPNIATALGGARLGAMAGAPFGVPGAVIGGIAGAAIPSLFQQAGGNIQRQAEEAIARGETPEISRARAFGAAVPQAALDVAGTFIPLGRTLVGKALGPNVEKALAKGAEEAAEKLAKESLAKTLAKGTAVGAIAEIPTEVAQQMLERAQAGLSLTSEEALKEYGETAYQTGLLAPIGAAGRVAERGAARNRQELRAQEEQAKQTEARRAQEAAAAQQAEAAKQTPEYAIKFATDHEALQKEYDDLGTQLKQKLPPGASIADKQAMESLKERRKELKQQLTEQAKEYNRIRPVADEVRQREVEARMGEEQFAGPMQQQMLPGIERAALPPEEEAKPEFSPQELASRRQRIDLLMQQNADAQVKALKANDTKAQARLDKEYGQLKEAKTGLEKLLESAGFKIPEVAAAERDALQAQLAKKQEALQRMLQRHTEEIEPYSPEKGSKLRTEIADIQKQLENYGVEQGRVPQAQLDMGEVFRLPPPETRTQFAARMYKPGAPDIEAQEQALREEEARAEEQRLTEERRQQRLAPEVTALQRMAERPAPRMQFAMPVEAEKLIDRIMSATEPGEQNRVMASLTQQLSMAPATMRYDRASALLRDVQGKLETAEGDEKTRLEKRQTQLERAQAALGKEVNRSLFDAVSTLGEQGLFPRNVLKPTGEARRVPGGFQLFGEAEPAAREVTRDELQERITRVMASNKLSDDAYDFLRRIEATLPATDRAVEGERRPTEGLKPGVRYTTAATTPGYVTNKKGDEAKISYPARLEDGTEVTVEIIRPISKYGNIQPEVADVRVRQGKNTPFLNLGKQGKQTDEQLLKMLVDIEQIAGVSRPKGIAPEGEGAAPARSLYSLLDEQLRRIESGEEGMARPGAGRVTTLQAFPAEGRADVAGATLANAEDKARQYLYQQKLKEGMKPDAARDVAFKATRDELIAAAEAENPALARTIRTASAAVTKRPARDITPTRFEGEQRVPGTIRGPSTKALPLSLQAEIEPFVAQTEAAREEDMGQMALFPSEQKKIAATRATPEAFQRYLDSEWVQGLRKKFEPVTKKLARARDQLNALTDRIKEVNGVVAEIEAAQETAFPAQKIASAKKELAALEARPRMKTGELAEGVADRIAALRDVIRVGEAQEARLKAARERIERGELKSMREELADVQQQFGSVLSAVARRGQLRAAVVELQVPRNLSEEFRSQEGFIKQFNISEEDKALLLEQLNAKADETAVGKHVKALNRQIAAIDTALARVDAVARVADAEMRVRDYEMRNMPPEADDRATLAAAKRELSEAQAAASKLKKEIGALEGTSAAQEAANRRAQAARNKAEEELKRTKGYLAKQAALEQQQRAPEGVDKFGQPLRSMAYDPITDAQRAAREDDTPTILVDEMRQVRGNPQQVLKGYRAYISTITKALKEAFDKARQQTVEGVKERAPYENALRAYQEAKTSQARANIEPKLAKLETAYNAAVTNALNARVMPKGLVGYQAALSEMLRREAWLKGLIDRGEVEVAEPPKPRKRKTEAELAEIQAVLREKDIAEAAAREGAPVLDVTATTKTDIEQERKAKGTLYSSKGVGQETAISEEVKRVKKEQQILLKKEPTAEEKARLAELTIINQALDKQERKEPLTELEQMLLADYRRSRKPLKESEVERQKREAEGEEELTSEELAEKARAREQEEFDAEEVAETGIVKTGNEELDALFDKPDTLEQLAATASQGPALKEKVDTEDNAAAVMQNIAKTTSSDITRAITERLKMLLSNTRVEIVNNLRDPDGQAAYGQAAADGSFIRLDAKYGLNERTAVHEGVHAATERVIQMPEDQLTDDQLRAKRELEDLFAAYKKLSGATNANAKTSLSEFASEAMSDDVMQAEMRAQPWTLKHMWDSFKSAILNLLGIKTPKNMLEATLAAVDNLMTRVPRPTAADNALLAPKLLNRPMALNPALIGADAVARQVVAKDLTITQKLRAVSTGMAMETNLIDRFAGFERLSKYMDKLKGSQMMFYLRMYDQRMNFTAQSAANGALEVREVKRRDGEREFLVESKPGASLQQVVKTLKGAAKIVGDVNATSRLFSLYLIAKRADRVGFDKLDFSGKITEADVKRAVAEVNSIRELKDIFDNARDIYNEYNENLVRFGQQTGIFSKKDADALLRSKDYIPFYRERNGVVQLTIGGEAPITVGNIKDMPHLAELVGGDTKIVDFMVSSVQNTNMLVDMSLRNLATRNAMFELVDLGAAKITPKPVSGTNVVKFKHEGQDRYAILDTEQIEVGGKKIDTGVPADLLVKGMEGIPLQTTGVMRLALLPAQLLRRAVTLNPLYMVRQLMRDSLSAYIVSGADITPVYSALKEVGSSAKGTLERRGITGGQMFTGTQEDLSRVMRHLADPDGGLRLLSRLEVVGMEADALTRRAQYNSYIKQGMSEMEATLLALESMNFNKRGASPSIHMANSLIPFFNAQIQGLNVLYKAMFGQITAAEKARIKQKLITRGAMMFAASLAYAHAMQDDEAYKNALPAEKYGNWFVRIPGISEPVRIPIPFEVGYIFKALPEALYNTIMTKRGAEEAKEALLGILRNTVPGGSSFFIPQAMKPAIEVLTNHSLFTERPLVSGKEQALLPEYQYRNNTTEAAKLFGGMTGVSPIKLEALVNGYFSTMGMVLLQLASLPIPRKDSPEKAEKRLSEMPVVGSAFQPNDARWVINSTYDALDDARKVQASYKELVNRGEKAEARALLDARANDYAKAELAGYYRQQMGMLTQYRTAINASNKSPQEKRALLDRVRQIEIRLSSMVRDASDSSRYAKT